MRRRFLALLSLAFLLASCSPTYNWREVRLPGAELKALLPCKPDQASREQSLAGQAYTIAMQGCETGGALFAVAVVELGQESRAQAVQQQWQIQLLGTMQAAAPASASFALRGASTQFEPLRLNARGQRPDGRPVEVQGVWFARGARLYHAVIYAERIRSEMSEPFFGGLELP